MATSKAERLNKLRELAQNHLSEIETDKTLEEAQEAKAESEIRQYAKMSSFDRKKLVNNEQRIHLLDSRAESSVDMSTPKDRLTPFKEILHRLKWDPKLNINEYIVGYLERFEGIKEISASSWITDFSEEEWIPMHRVRYVKRKSCSTNTSDEGPDLGIVWSRDLRINRFSQQVHIDHDDILSVDASEGGVVV